MFILTLFFRNKYLSLYILNICRKHKKGKKENGESKLKDKKKSNGDNIQNGKQKRPPSPPVCDNKKKKTERQIIEINLNEEEMNLEELMKQKVFYKQNYNILSLKELINTYKVPL